MKKNLIIIAGLCTLIFSACKTSELSSFEDDIYKNPAEELQIARAKQAAEAKLQAEENARARQEAIAKKEAEDNNPYYQDPKENADDYYDYKYASRINRFSNPVSGAGYYDSRYTNYYTYNQNPMMFGSSIYSSYNWMPSNQFNNYSMGISLGYNSFGGGYGYSPFGSSYYGSFGTPFYDPFNPYGYGGGFGYGYSPFGYSPYGFSSYNYDPYYSGYSMGYHQGFYNGYNSGGWGYLNSFDANSGYSQMVNAPRGSNGGGNSAGRTSEPRSGASGGDGQRQQFMQSMAEQQRNTPRFSESNRGVRTNGSMPANVNNGNVTNGGDSRSSNPRTSNPRDNNSRDNSIRDNGQQQTVNPNTANPQRRESRERVESQPANVTPQQTPAGNNRGSGSGGSNSGGGSSSPRGGGGGNSGGGRPR